MVTKIFPFVEGRFVGAILFLVIAGLAIYYIFYSKKQVPIRRVPALDAIDEGIGRAAEMGKPVIDSIGICSAGMDYWTVSAISILSYTASRCAELGVPLYVPLGGHDNSYTPMEVARDVVKTQYELAGKPEEFKLENMPFLSGRQFSWASGYVGMLMRLKPAANIMLGDNLASAMWLSEIGHNIGALQISGATYISNIAVLAVSSDYVAIGEDMLAAGAYLSKDQSQIASIRTEDIIKILAIVLVVAGAIIASLGSNIVQTILSI
jgi:hypothetical protein